MLDTVVQCKCLRCRRSTQGSLGHDGVDAVVLRPEGAGVERINAGVGLCGAAALSECVPQDASAMAVDRRTDETVESRDERWHITCRIWPDLA